VLLPAPAGVNSRLRLVWFLVAVALLCLAVPAAAAGDTGDLTLVLDRTACAPGDTLQVSVTNRTDRTALFAFVCDLFVEGHADSAWVTVFKPDCSRIRVRPTRLAPGATLLIPHRLEIDPSATPAKYPELRLRLRVQLEGGGGYRSVYSPLFKFSPR